MVILDSESWKEENGLVSDGGKKVEGDNGTISMIALSP
jgi:hypothetical protein